MKKILLVLSLVATLLFVPTVNNSVEASQSEPYYDCYYEWEYDWWTDTYYEVEYCGWYYY